MGENLCKVFGVEQGEVFSIQSQDTHVSHFTNNSKVNNV